MFLAKFFILLEKPATILDCINTYHQMRCTDKVLKLSQISTELNHWRAAEQLPERILELIKMYNDRGARHIDGVTKIRAMNEESYQFEKGYLMSECLERYRKMVGIAQKSALSRMDSNFETVKYLELIQKLFMELHHLVNMMHEVDRKYNHFEEDDEEMNDYDPALYAKSDAKIKRIEEIEKIRHLEKIAKLKQLKKQRDLFMKQASSLSPVSYESMEFPESSPPSASSPPYATSSTKMVYHNHSSSGNKWWPIDYGWEVDYKWFDEHS